MPSDYSLEMKEISELNLTQGFVTIFFTSGNTPENGIEGNYIFVAADDFASEDYNYQNGVATFTEEHLNELFEKNRKKGGENASENYAEEYAAFIDPVDFLYLTSKNEKQRKHLKSQAGKLDAASLTQKSAQELPFLQVDMATGRVTDHEGRHRLIAMRDAGITKVAVLIKPNAQGDNKNRVKTNILLKGSIFDTEAEDGAVIRSASKHSALVTAYPLSAAYEETVYDMFGSSGDLRFSEETSEESSEKYSYDALTSKPDITVTEINDKKTYAVNKQTRTDIINAAIANAKNVGRVNANGNAVVRVKDTDTDVIVSKSGVEHSLDRRLNILGAVSENIGSILQNAICINELTPKKASASDSYVYIGAARGANDFYTVQFIVNRYSNELSKIDILYAANAKKEAAALDAPRVTNKSLPITASTISIAELLEYVNRYFPDILPESVLRHFGHTSRPEGVIGESALYSEETDENTKAVRNERTLRKQVERLKTLVKLQGNITHGSVFTDASVGKQVTELLAKYNIKQNANSKVKEALHKFYAFISTAKEFDWNGIQREAGKVAAILLENERLNVGDFFIFM